MQLMLMQCMQIKFAARKNADNSDEIRFRIYACCAIMSKKRAHNLMQSHTIYLRTCTQQLVPSLIYSIILSSELKKEDPDFTFNITGWRICTHTPSLAHVGLKLINLIFTDGINFRELSWLKSSCGKYIHAQELLSTMIQCVSSPLISLHILSIS